MKNEAMVMGRQAWPGNTDQDLKGGTIDAGFFDAD